MSIYLDYAASAPLNEGARKSLLKSLQERDHANPNALHRLGREAFSKLENARSVIAQSIGARPYEVTFTSGGTESDILAVIGISEAVREKTGRDTIIISAIEHSAVSGAAQLAEKRGFTVLTAPVDSSGLINQEALEKLLSKSVALVSIIAVNNETGIIQPLEEISTMVHRVGAIMHTDAVQLFGQLPTNVSELGVDALTITAHKCGGPVGVGALYLKRGTPIKPQMLGGGQERDLRPGTQPVMLAQAFAAAAKFRLESLKADMAHRQEIKQYMLDSFQEFNGLIKPTVDPSKPLAPGTLSILVQGHESENLILQLDNAGFEVAGGSACSSGSHKASKTLLAMGYKPQDVQGVLRISFGPELTFNEADAFIQSLREILGV